ncbi:hypothetical protein [[Limnothrix rosea] IAM M-220]|uniref:hypothetical protein n=1 Tax=[Limnothrix rosea] IAM M-220 TaxID=454133 RepID=UPI0009659D1B|nr:hypothetical protein [[Limnothrix rosea] IAM M-220]OKH13182.1 hypothetical protein NIES208_15265 [[Limnothrix rosea] IAM M-220]
MRLLKTRKSIAGIGAVAVLAALFYIFPSQTLSPTLILQNMFGSRAQSQATIREFELDKSFLTFTEELADNSTGANIWFSAPLIILADPSQKTDFPSTNIFNTDFSLCNPLKQSDFQSVCVADLLTQDSSILVLESPFGSWPQDSAALGSFLLHEQQKRDEDMRNRVGKKGYYYYQDNKVFWLDENAPPPQGAIPLDTKADH